MLSTTIVRIFALALSLQLAGAGSATAGGASGGNGQMSASVASSGFGNALLEELPGLTLDFFTSLFTQSHFHPSSPAKQAYEAGETAVDESVRFLEDVEPRIEEAVDLAIDLYTDGGTSPVTTEATLREIQYVACSSAGCGLNPGARKVVNQEVEDELRARGLDAY